MISVMWSRVSTLLKIWKNLENAVDFFCRETADILLQTPGIFEIHIQKKLKFTKHQSIEFAEKPTITKATAAVDQQPVVLSPSLFISFISFIVCQLLSFVYTHFSFLILEAFYLFY